MSSPVTTCATKYPSYIQNFGDDEETFNYHNYLEIV